MGLPLLSRHFSATAKVRFRRFPKPQTANIAKYLWFSTNLPSYGGGVGGVVVVGGVDGPVPPH